MLVRTLYGAEKIIHQCCKRTDYNLQENLIWSLTAPIWNPCPLPPATLLLPPPPTLSNIITKIVMQQPHFHQ